MKKLIFAIALVLSAGNIFSASQPAETENSRNDELNKLGGLITGLAGFPKNNAEWERWESLRPYLTGSLNQDEAGEFMRLLYLPQVQELTKEQKKRLEELYDKRTKGSSNL